jgi:hypothetical protein
MVLSCQERCFTRTKVPYFIHEGKLCFPLYGSKPKPGRRYQLSVVNDYPRFAKVRVIKEL